MQCNATQLLLTNDPTFYADENSVDLRCDKGGGGGAQSGIAGGMELKRNRFSKLKRPNAGYITRRDGFDSEKCTCFNRILTSADLLGRREGEGKILNLWETSPLLRGKLKLNLGNECPGGKDSCGGKDEKSVSRRIYINRPRERNRIE